MDRAGDLRSDQGRIDQLWQKALIIEVGKGRIRSNNDGPIFLAASEAVGGERYFLGIDRSTETAYFAWASGAVKKRSGENSKTKPAAKPLPAPGCSICWAKC